MTGNRNTKKALTGDAFRQQDGQQTDPQDGLQGLVFVNDYQPGVGFQVVSRVQQPTVNQILGYVDPANPNQGNGAVVDPAEWNGYIVNYQGCGPGNYDIVFLREGTLQQGQTYSFTTDAVFFSDQIQLLESQIQRGTGGARTTTAEDGEAGAQEETAEGEAAGAQDEATTTQETTPTEETTTETTTTETTTTTEETTTTETTTPPDETTTTAEANETTTESVIVNATETGDG